MQFIKNGLSIATLLALSQVAVAASLTVVSGGGADKEAQTLAFYGPYKKQFGTEIVGSEYNGEMAKIKAMVDTKTVSWDVVEVSGSELDRACQDGLLEKIDVKKIGNKSDFIQGAVQQCGIGMVAWSTTMAYDGNKLKVAPKTWADFWDVKKFPGKRGMRKSANSTLEFALLADGVAPKDIYKVLATTQGQERAFRKLDQLKPYIQWWEAGAQAPQILVSGDVVMTTAYSGRIAKANQEGKNLKLVWSGHIYAIDYWTIPKGSPNKDEALKFISFATKPENQKVAVEYLPYGPSNKQTNKLLNPTFLAQLPTDPKNLVQGVALDSAFWADYGEQLEQKFNAWAAK